MAQLLRAVFLLVLPFTADSDTFQLAEIRDRATESAKIEVPDNTEGGHVIVRCAAASQPNTENVPYICYRPNPENDPYVLAIDNALPMLPLTPARVNGKEVHTWFNFSIVFLHESDKAEIFPSLLYAPPNEITAYFSAPQRILKHKGPRGCRSNQVAWATLQVDENGETVVPADLPKPETSCGRNALRLLKKSKFIPAAFNGQAIASLYREPFEKEMAKTPDEIRQYGGRTTRRLPSGLVPPISPPSLQ